MIIKSLIRAFKYRVRLEELCKKLMLNHGLPNDTYKYYYQMWNEQIVFNALPHALIVIAMDCNGISMKLPIPYSGKLRVIIYELELGEVPEVKWVTEVYEYKSLWQ